MMLYQDLKHNIVCTVKLFLKARWMQSLKVDLWTLLKYIFAKIVHYVRLSSNMKLLVRKW